ncbi:MAG: Wzz/FepE/Etk N-terminal domain-containing protein [Endomicrobiia bacterium]
MEEDIEIIDVIKFFIRNKKIITICFIFSLILGIIWVAFQKKTYTAEAGIIVLGVKPKITFEPKIQIKEISEGVIQQFDERKKTIVEFLRSPVVISEVIEKLKNQGHINQSEKFSVESFIKSKKILNIETVGELIKVKVRLKDRELAKRFADEIVKTTVEKMVYFTYYEIPTDILKNKLLEAQKNYKDAVERYNLFVQENKILEINKRLSQLQDMYNYYVVNITKIEKYIWEAKGLKAQLQKEDFSSVGELGNALAMLRFKSSIFIEDKFEKVEIEKIDKELLKLQDIKLAIKEIDETIEILEARKKEFEKKLEEEKYEQQIQQLKKELEKEMDKEKQLIKDKDLYWDMLLTLERKQKEIEISNGISENIPVKIAYFSFLPEKPDDGRYMVFLLGFMFLGLLIGVTISGVKEIYKILI